MSAAGIWRGEVSVLGLSAAEPGAFPAPGFGVLGGAALGAASLGSSQELREPQILRKTKIGKTTDVRVVTPCPHPSSSWGHFVTSLVWGTEQQGWMWPGPGWAGTVPVPVTTAWPKLGRMAGDSRCRDSSVCLCCAWGASFSSLCQQFAPFLLSLLHSLPAAGHADIPANSNGCSVFFTFRYRL